MTELAIGDVAVTLVVEEGDSNTLVIEQSATEVTVSTTEYALEVADTGVQGPPGPASTVPGPQGPQGPPGNPGSAPQAYVHDQAVPSDTWVITHSLGYQPNVTVVDSALTTIEGGISYDSANQITLTFTYSFAGKAYLS